MVTLHVGGKAVSWADAEKVFADAARTEPVEFRDAAGRLLATSVPVVAAEEPLVPWDPSITQEEIDRRRTEPGFTFEEMKKRLGWE